MDQLFSELPAKPNGAIRIVQISDWHVGRLPPMLVASRSKERYATVLKLLETLPSALQTIGADAILLPGDLYQSEDIPFEEVGRVIGVLNRLAPLPIVIAAGNHDPLHPLSYYSSQLVQKRSHGKVSYGDHIRIADGSWQRFEFDGFAVTAKSFVSHAKRNAPALQDAPARGKAPVEVLCVHGSLGDVPDGQEAVAPVAFSDLQKLGYQYAALGHYHRAQSYAVSNQVLAGYAGCFAGLRKSDTGPNGVVVVDVTSKGVATSDWHLVRVDSFRIVDVDVVVDGQSDLSALIFSAFEQCKVNAQDYARITLRGRAAPGVVKLPKEEELLAFCYGFDLHNTIESDWNLELLEHGTSTEAIFVRTLRERLAVAKSNGDEASIKLISDALDLGLQALQFGQIAHEPPSFRKHAH